MISRPPLFLLPALTLLAALHGQTPPEQPTATAAPASAPAPAENAAPAPARAPATPATSGAAAASEPAVPSKEQALKEIDAGLASLELAARTEPSPVIHAAMMTRLTVLRQRRAELAKTFTPGRFRSLQASILQEVRIDSKLTPSSDPNEGRLRRPLTLEESVQAATSDANRALALDAARREEQSRADRAAEESSRRLMEVSRINADLARLSAQIDASTVGDPNRRAEMTLRLRELEHERTRLEWSTQPTTFDQLRLEIQREADRAR